MRPKRKTHFIKLNFIWDTEIDSDIYQVTLAANVKPNHIAKIIRKEHELLCEDDNSIYNTNGRTPESLIQYLNEKYHWNCKKLEYAVTIDLL